MIVGLIEPGDGERLLILGIYYAGFHIVVLGTEPLSLFFGAATESHSLGIHDRVSDSVILMVTDLMPGYEALAETITQALNEGVR